MPEGLHLVPDTPPLGRVHDGIVACPKPLSTADAGGTHTLLVRKEARDVRTKLRLYAAVFAIVALGVLASGPAATAAHGHGKQTLRLVATQIQSEFLDLGTAGPSLGDQFVFSETLFRHGREVGVSGGVCTVTQVVPPYDVVTFHCVATLSLGRGQITLQGLLEFQGEDDPGPFTVAITGGTGAFFGASGEAIDFRASATRSIYKLRFDSRKKQHQNKHHKR